MLFCVSRMGRHCESSEQGEGRDEKRKGGKRKANDGVSFKALLFCVSRMGRHCESSEQGEGREEKEK